MPPEIYFEALAEIVPGDRNISKDEFDKWEKNANLHPKMMFTKRVNRWLKEEFGTCLDKPQVMARALEIVELDQVEKNTISVLIEKIRKTSKRL